MRAAKTACPISWSMDAMLCDVIAVVIVSLSRPLAIPLTIFTVGKGDSRVLWVWDSANIYPNCYISFPENYFIQRLELNSKTTVIDQFRYIKILTLLWSQGEQNNNSK